MTEWVWTFHGEGAALCSGVFTCRNKAEQWIRQHRLSGILTRMPLETGIYDWSIDTNIFQIRKEQQKTSRFIQSFTSAYLEHYHYTDGIDGCSEPE